MRFDAIGYHHWHDENFFMDRPDGSGDWLMLIVKSPAIFRIKNDTVKINKTSFIIYTSDFPQYYKADGSAYVDDWIHFQPFCEDTELMEKLEIPLNTITPINNAEALSKIVKNMCFEYYSDTRNRTEITELYFKILLHKINEQIRHYNTDVLYTENAYAQQLIWIRECIYRFPADKYSIAELAKQVSLSSSRLQHIYIEAFGVSISHEIIKSRLMNACSLLLSTDMSFEKIAIECGYSNTSYFLTLFKNKIGTTPLKFKEKYKNNSDEFKKMLWLPSD